MRKHKFLISLLAIIPLSACENNEINRPLNERAITVIASVQQTKAGYENGVLMPQNFIMDIYQGSDEKYDYSLIEMTKNTSGNTYFATNGTELLWADENHNADVKAMTIPFGLSTVDPDNTMIINVSTEQNNPLNVAASDLLGATSQPNGGISIENTNINIEFQHLLSKLDVQYEFSSEFDENAVEINSITLQNICTTGGYSYAEMAHTAATLQYGDIKMYNNTSESTAEAIFYPYRPTENPSLLINATIDEEIYNFTCPVVAKDANGFIAGKRYTMKVSIKGSSVSGTEVSIAKGWDNNTQDESFVTE
ncbi:MAG: fimbrillin family protein [Bacteroidales bacterium]|nr:fimbrillin family protein [Bacteroidales bacterium]